MHMQYLNISSDGDEFQAEFNSHGAIFTSVYPKHFFEGVGVNAKAVTKKAVIYLGNQCDVSSPFYGKGVWTWANGGFVLAFENKKLSFGRQEIQIEDNGKCRM